MSLTERRYGPIGCWRHIKRLFRWAASRDLIETDPAAHIEKPSPEVRRDRVLDDGELVEIWRALEGISGPFGSGCAC